MTTLRLTYDELAERLGKSAEGARMLARRRHWRIERGNDGKARVVVDEADLVARPTGRPPGHLTSRPDADHPDGELVSELRKRIQTLEYEREALIEAGDRLSDELLATAQRAARAEGEVAALRDALGDLSRRLDKATDELRELRRPWWRRLIRP
jgi:hypothetical protein